MALALGTNKATWINSSASTITESGITLAANSTIFVLGIINDGTNNREASAPTFSGASLTQAGTNQVGGGSEFNIELWYKLSPSLASSSLSIPNSGLESLYYTYISLTSTAGGLFFNVNQTGNTTADPSLTINNVPAGGACVSILGDGYRNAPTGRSHTVISEIDQGQFSTNGQYGLISSLSNVTMTWTDSADNWAMIMAAFQEFVSGGTVSNIIII